MYKKLTITISFLCACTLAYFANKYFEAQEYKLVAVEKTEDLSAAATNFYNYGFIICMVSWLWVNIVVVKTKQFFWLLLPLLFVIIVAVLIGYQASDIFIFNKQNGLWKGGFSITYIVTVFIIIFAAIIIGIDYVALKNALKNKVVETN